MDIAEQLNKMLEEGQRSVTRSGYCEPADLGDVKLPECTDSETTDSSIEHKTFVIESGYNKWEVPEPTIPLPTKKLYCHIPPKAIDSTLEFAQPYKEYANGVKLPASVAVPPPNVSEEEASIEPPQDEELKRNPTELVAKKLLPAPAMREEQSEREEANKLMFKDMAEVILTNFAAHGDKIHSQKYIATGGNMKLAEIPPDPWTGIQSGTVKAVDLWNSKVALPCIRTFFNDGSTVLTDLSKIVGEDVLWPLLCVATLSNYGNVTAYNMNAMAVRICTDMHLDPSHYPAGSIFQFEADSPVQYSALADQNKIIDGIPFCGNGGQTRYWLQKCKIQGGKGEKKFVYVPVVPLAMVGCPITRPTFCPPEKAIFFRQNEILDDESGKVIFMTSKLDYAFDLKTRSCPECIVTTAWRLENCLDDGNEDETPLPWYVFRGKIVCYLLLADAYDVKHEFDVALRCCRKIEQSGSGHAKIIVIKDGNVWETVYDCNTFWKLRSDLQLEDADLYGFADLSDHSVAPGGPTAISYMKQKNLFLVLGAPKTGKTWFCLLAGWKLANGPQSGLVIYCHGECEPEEIEEHWQIVNEAMQKQSGDGKDGHVSFASVNLNDRNWGDEGFDLKRPEHRDHLKRKVREIKEKSHLPLVAVILDNYATLLGKNQEGSAAIPLLDMCKDFQKTGCVVLLACHTNAKGEVAGSSHLRRRANGIVRIEKEAVWKIEIRSKLDSAASKQKGGDAVLTCLKEIEKDIVAEESKRVNIHMELTFESFRGECPLPKEIDLGIKERTIRETIFTPDRKKEFAEKYAEQLINADVDGNGGENDIDSSADTITESTALNHVLPCFQEIKLKSSVEEQKECIMQWVNTKGCKTRTDLAKVLGVTPDTLDSFMKGRIKNEEIGLQNGVGRPRKN